MVHSIGNNNFGRIVLLLKLPYGIDATNVNENNGIIWKNVLNVRSAFRARVMKSILNETTSKIHNQRFRQPDLRSLEPETSFILVNN